MPNPEELDDAALAGVLNALALPVLVLDDQGLVLHTNDAADDHFPVMEGDPWLDVLGPSERSAGEAALEAARENRTARLECERAGRRWALQVQPSHVGPVVTARERDDDPRAAERETAAIAAERARMAEAMGEMEHRVLNLLAMLPAIVKLSLRRTTDVKAARSAVVGRISALASAHSMMLTPEAIEEGVSLDGMIDAVLLPHDDARVVASGPPVRLATRGSNTVALTLHELASNAAAYGALSVPDGRVRIAWAIESSARDVALPEGAQSVLRLLWAETGGPHIDNPPVHRGFGMEVVDRLIMSQGGTIEREWLIHGLNVTIDLPLYALGREPKFAGDLRAGGAGAPAVAAPATDEAATQIVARAVAAAGGAGAAETRGAQPEPIREPSGPSEGEIVDKLERIIRNAPAG